MLYSAENESLKASFPDVACEERDAISRVMAACRR